MNIFEREHAISALIAAIGADTTAIIGAHAEAAKHEEARAQAVYRLVHLMDPRFEQIGGDAYDRVLADMLLAEIFKTGASGAPVSHLFALVRNRFGDAFQSKHVRQALGALQRAGEVVDREHLWFATAMFAETVPSENMPPDIRGRIIQILADHPQGLRAREILTQMRARYKVSLPQANVAGVLTKMKHAGRVRHEGKIWRLTNAAD